MLTSVKRIAGHNSFIRTDRIKKAGYFTLLGVLAGHCCRYIWKRRDCPTSNFTILQAEYF